MAQRDRDRIGTNRPGRLIVATGDEHADHLSLVRCRLPRLDPNLRTKCRHLTISADRYQIGARPRKSTVLMVPDRHVSESHSRHCAQWGSGWAQGAKPLVVCEDGDPEPTTSRPIARARQLLCPRDGRRGPQGPTATRHRGKPAPGDRSLGRTRGSFQGIIVRPPRVRRGGAGARPGDEGSPDGRYGWGVEGVVRRGRRLHRPQRGGPGVFASCVGRPV